MVPMRIILWGIVRPGAFGETCMKCLVKALLLVVLAAATAHAQQVQREPARIGWITYNSQAVRSSRACASSAMSKAGPS